MSIFYQVFDFIDLASNVFQLFSLVCVSSHWTFLSFWISPFVGFFLLRKDAFFRLSRFSLITIASHRTVHLGFDLVGMHSVTASIWAVTVLIFLIWGISFRYLLKSIKVIFYSYHIMISRFLISLLMSEDQLYIYIYIYIYIL